MGYNLWVEYYSVVKRNDPESAEPRWLNLQPVTQSEVNQEDKNEHHILTHIYGI